MDKSQRSLFQEMQGLTLKYRKIILSQNQITI